MLVLHDDAERASMRTALPKGCPIRRSEPSPRQPTTRPRTITGVITLSVAHGKSGIPVTVLAAVAVATTVMWLLIVLVARLGAKDSGGFVHDVVTRFMGLIVIAMGVQFALSGIRSFMLEPDCAAPQRDDQQEQSPST